VLSRRGEKAMLWLTLRKLKSKDKKIRLAAVADLSHSKNSDSLAPLRSAATCDLHQEVRLAAVNALVERRDSTGLRLALRDPEAEIRYTAVRALGETGDDEWFTWAVLDTTGGGECMSDLAAIKQLMAETNPDVRASAQKALGAAMRALGATGNIKYVKELVQIRDVGPPAVRDSAQKALSDLGYFIMRGIVFSESQYPGPLQPYPPRTKFDRFALGGVRNEQAAHMISEAEARLKVIGEAAVEPLIVVLNDRDRDQRQYHAFNKDVRQRAVWALGKLATTRACQALIDALGTKRIVGVENLSEDAKLALEDLGDSAAGELVLGIRRFVPLECLDRPVPLSEFDVSPVSLTLIRMLGSLSEGGNQTAISGLVEVFRSGGGWIRFAAAEELGRIGWQPANVEEQVWLGVAYHHRDDAQVKCRRMEIANLGGAAVKALADIVKVAGSSGLRPFELNPGAAVFVLSRIDDPAALAVLERVVLNRRMGQQLRLVATKALARVGRFEALTTLDKEFKTRFNDGDKDIGFLTRGAIAELGSIGSANGVDWLAAKARSLYDAQRGNNMFQEIAHALGAIRHPRAVAALIDMVQNSKYPSCALKELKQILSKGPDVLETADLQALARMSDLKEEWAGWTEQQTPTYGEELLDCTVVRELARSELDRRKISA
jgi:HEAT repeat protein